MEVIDRVSEMRDRLSQHLRVPRRWMGLLRRSTLGRVIRGSNSIEGYRLSKDDVVAAATGEVVEADESTRLATESYRRAMTYVLQLSSDPHFAWSPSLIKSLHFMMLEHDLSKNPGQWRVKPIFVVDEDKGEQVYEGSQYSVVPALMNELVATLATQDTTTPEIVRAAMAHLNLVMIHPFSDGNGRMARCLQTLVLGRAGSLEPPFSSIEENLGENHRAYYDVLAAVGRGSWHPENDAHPWIRFCLRAHYYQAQTLLRRTTEAEQIWNSLEQQVNILRLPERTVLALWDAAHGYKVKNSTYRAAAEISDQLAGRDLRALVGAGLLVPEHEKRARFYTASQTVFDVRRAAMEDRPAIRDPFEETKASVPTMPGLTRIGFAIKGAVTNPSSTGPRPPRERN